MKIKTVTINHFRGIERLENFELKDLSLIIGNNGTSKTSVLEAINYALSPSFLSGRIKHTDFFKGLDNPIVIDIKFDSSFIVNLPDGYTTQKVDCNRIYLRIKKRDRAASGKAFSDIVVVEHFVVPAAVRDNSDGWIIKRASGSKFKFNERQLAFPLDSEGLPRSFYFGRNREKQIQKGFNSSITSVFEDFNWRFIKTLRNEDESTYFADKINLENSIIERVDDKVLERTITSINNKLKDFGIENVSMSFFEANAPFDSAFLNQIKDKIEIPVSQLGSGIEMIVTLVFLETLASLSKDNFIIIIDEPELHLHPFLQSKLLRYLKSLASTVQVILSTHSPYFYKDCFNYSNIELLISSKTDQGKIEITNTGGVNGLFPWSPSWGEINYNAYSMVTLEFHNELYGYIQEQNSVWKEKDIESYLVSKNIVQEKNWIKEIGGVAQFPYAVTKMTYIRNKIHHPENKYNLDYSETEIEESIKEMIWIILNP